MKIFKRLIPLFLLALVFILPTDYIKASGNSILSNIPFDNPVNHNYGREDFSRAEAILVFGNSELNRDTDGYLSVADNLMENHDIHFNLLYYDMYNSTKETISFLNTRQYNNFYVFSGGRSEMWNILRSQGIEDGVYLPIVMYVDSDGQLTNLVNGRKSQTEIIDAIKEHLSLVEQEQLQEEVKILTPTPKPSSTTNPVNPIISDYKVLADEVGNEFETRRSEIEYQLMFIDKTSKASYEKTPNLTAPYSAGALSQSYLQNGLRTINLVRFLSGLPEVRLDSEYNSYAQHGAVLMHASSYGHYPARPSNMSETFYKEGYTGTSKGNIYWGYKTLFDGIVHGWMADEDISNIHALGHRRWTLNPRMGATGLGEANESRPLAAMYAIDQSATASKYDAIAYPSGSAFPSEFFKGDYPWSISLNSDIFSTPDINSVSVTLTGGGKTYTFNKNNKSFEGNFFHIDTGNYGISNSIVFRPIGIDKYLGTYQVQIHGLKTVLGKAVTFSYETTFFDDNYVHIPNEPKLDTPSNWAAQGVERAASLNLIPEAINSKYTTPITRAEFSKLAVRLYESVYGTITPTAYFSDTSDIDVRKMATLGIVSGTGNGNFSPNEKITREQAAKILDLLLENLGYSALKDKVSYADQTSIANWAKEYVYSVTNRGIMGGVSGNKFDPKGYFTREQSILTMLRIWDISY